MFRYDREFGRIIFRSSININLRREFIWSSPVRVMAQLIESWSQVFEEQFAQRPAETLYYAFVEPFYANDYPPENGLFWMTAEKAGEEAPRNVALLDWLLLPAALRLASGGAKIWLPVRRKEDYLSNPKHWSSARYGEADAKKMSAFLRDKFPEGGWFLEEPSSPAFLLGFDILRHCKSDSSFLEKIKAAEGALFVCPWNFLSAPMSRHARNFLLETGRIKSVFQFPKPKFRRSNFFPALITFGAREHEEIHLSRIAPDKEIFVRTAAIMRQPQRNLLPTAWFAGIDENFEGERLRDYADVLRCQLPRQKYDFDDPEASRSLLDIAFSEDRRAVLEVGQDDIDPACGFLREDAGSLVELKISPLENSGKYLLQAGDILFVMRGSEDSLGAAGLVDEVDDKVVTARHICIIRPLAGVSAPWLFSVLKSPRMKETILTKASCKGQLVINTEDIKELRVGPPDMEEVKIYEEKYRALAEEVKKMEQIRQKMRMIISRADQEIKKLGKNE